MAPLGDVVVFEAGSLGFLGWVGPVGWEMPTLLSDVDQIVTALEGSPALREAVFLRLLDVPELLDLVPSPVAQGPKGTLPGMGVFSWMGRTVPETIPCVAPIDASLIAAARGILEQRGYPVGIVMVPPRDLADFRLSNFFDPVTKKSDQDAGLAGWMFGMPIYTSPSFPAGTVYVLGETDPDKLEDLTTSQIVVIDVDR